MPRSFRQYCKNEYVTNGIPADSDPYWIKPCGELLECVKLGPKTKTELFKWGTARGFSNTMVIQMLAWCENRHLVCYRDSQWIIGYYREHKS